MDTRRHIGQYEVGREVGRGGMAAVHEGLDTLLGRRVAIKLLHPHLAREAESRRRFHREARAVAQLRHPNIIEIYSCSGEDVADDEGEADQETAPETYIVTEFVDGPDLKRFVEKNPIRLPQVAAMIALPIASALGHAHARGIIHRDIKPENILIQSGGVLKLTDFGIAHFIDEQMTVTGAILGSPAYMSPEHIEGCALSPRSDVFSLGTLLYALAAGELPFRAEAPHALLRQILDCDVPDPRRANPLIDDKLLAIIRGAMNRRPEDRFGSIDDMEQALRRYLEAEGFHDPDSALRLFLDDPAGYQEALERSIATRLTTAAREAAGRGRIIKALKLYDRVLALDGDNEEVIEEVRRLSSRARRRRCFIRAAGGAAAALGLTAVVWAVGVFVLGPAFEAAPPFAKIDALRESVRSLVAAARAELDARGDADVDAAHPPGPRPPVVLAHAGEVRRDPYDLADMAPRRGRQALATELSRRRVPARPPRTNPRVGPRASGTPTVRRPPHPADARIAVVVKVFPPAVRISVDGVERGVGKTPAMMLAPGRHSVVLRHPACDICEETRETFALDPTHPPNAPLAFRIRYQPATLFVRSPVSGRVRVNRRPAGATSRPIAVPMGTRRERVVEVSVDAEGHLPWREAVRLTAGGVKRVAANPRPRPRP